MKVFNIKPLMLIILTLCADSAYAVWYQVELIIFEHLSLETDGEYWYTTPGLAPLKNTVRLRHPELIKLLGEEVGIDVSFTDEETPTVPESTAAIEEVEEMEPANSIPLPELIPYSLLPEDNKRLEGIYRVLSLSSDYQPLYHITWQQPGLDIDKVRPVHIQVEDKSNLFELTIPTTLVTDPMPSDFYEPIRLLVDGTVRIRSTLYLHVDMDMVLFRPPPSGQPEVPDRDVLMSDEFVEDSGLGFLDDQDLMMNDIDTKPDTIDMEELTGGEPVVENDPVEYVRLTESRRIRLNELHYFDHPLFGAIIQVSRYGEEDQDL